jgi:hypothetical protein
MLQQLIGSTVTVAVLISDNARHTHSNIRLLLLLELNQFSVRLCVNSLAL